MSIPRNLGNFADNVNSSGQVSLTTGVTGTLPVANGGTGAATLTANNVLLGNGTSAPQVVAPGSNGNILTSNGTTWVSSTPAAGGVTSVATGNGLSGGTITSTGTLTIAAPSFNSVGSYCFVLLNFFNPGPVAGSNYSAGTGQNQVQAVSWNVTGAPQQANVLSGSWKYMAASAAGQTDLLCICVRVS
jgi:hypothetical protein